MKKLLTFLFLFLTSSLFADYYSVQQQQVIKDTNTITNDWYYRGNFHLGYSTSIVQASMIPCYTVLRATGVVETLNVQTIGFTATNSTSTNIFNTSLYGQTFYTNGVDYFTFIDTHTATRMQLGRLSATRSGLDLISGSLYIDSILRYTSDGTMRATAGTTATPAFSFSSDIDTGFANIDSNNQIQAILGSVIFGTFTATDFQVGTNKIDGHDISQQFTDVATSTNTNYLTIQSTRTELLSVIASSHTSNYNALVSTRTALLSVIASSYTTNRTSITALEVSTGAARNEMIASTNSLVLVDRQLQIDLSTEVSDRIIADNVIKISTGILRSETIMSTASLVLVDRDLATSTGTLDTAKLDKSSATVTIMYKATYDTGNNGIVDNSEKLSGYGFTAVVSTWGYQEISGKKLFESTIRVEGGNMEIADGIQFVNADNTVMTSTTNFLGATQKATDSDLLDGNNSTWYANATDVAMSTVAIMNSTTDYFYKSGGIISNNLVVQASATVNWLNFSADNSSQTTSLGIGKKGQATKILIPVFSGRPATTTSTSFQNQDFKVLDLGNTEKWALEGSSVVIRFTAIISTGTVDLYNTDTGATITDSVLVSTVVATTPTSDCIQTTTIPMANFPSILNVIVIRLKGFGTATARLFDGQLWLEYNKQ